ncbi:DUF2284 domain-containing protein [Clostridium luticellarii]|jgi:predicted metal-binding protein|uniref:DUF2284 domain-containing protein n=1 Tax=Clostridium luticellarii TaxID=1691940 RepID=UPI0023578C4F|nr:DUF2284 domain-containing protein [Clostridium luticellarii]MCI1946380.1 DUF2284 domain-containing protein [Clostridium luticellarii]MCI1969625.1 DUF2284 domain-containing protein [Clostridium luticellarii]MCI1996939.1 DUF2284 domain-containing protein [Clostridium luticellarii]MCI2041065.1 DUF2284 domain-containing protein [Clostridium luticellarii]
MKSKFQSLVEEAIELKADHAAMIDVSQIKFYADARRACEKNVCGNYDTNWKGPPAIGPIDKLIDKAKRYEEGLLIQTVHQLSSPFDLKGMKDAAKVYEGIFRKILSHVRVKYKFKDILPLSAGCCRLCKVCTYVDGIECKFPDKAFSSLEAYGIDVIALEKSCGIPYYNGLNTISYVGLILFNEN